MPRIATGEQHVHRDDAARATAKVIQRLPSRFAFDPATYERGAELGFEGFDLYLCGRGGCLGDVPADEVVDAFGLFEPSVVRTGWERGTQVMPPAAAAQEWLGLNARWLGRRLPDELASSLADLAATVGEAAEEGGVEGAALFSALRRTPPPEGSAGELALHLTALRELRGAFHRRALAEVGLAPIEAIVVHDASMAGFYGWPEPWPDPAPLRARWEQAEAQTDAAMAQVLDRIDPGERAELVALGQRALADAEAGADGR
jgi:hypothetical protein